MFVKIFLPIFSLNPASKYEGKNSKEVTMKRLNISAIISAVVLVAVVYILVGGAVGRVQAESQQHSDVSGFCKDNDDFGMSHGACVSLGEANVNALAARGITDGVAICRALEQVFGPFNFGQCVIRYR
jgi:hypothetical protein